MSREQKIAAVEAYLNCFATKELPKIPLAEDITFEGPIVPKLTGRQTVKRFLASILPMVKGIQFKQHIVERDHVATVFDMERINGVDHVFDRIHIVDGEIKAIHTLYIPSRADSSGITTNHRSTLESGLIGLRWVERVSEHVGTIKSYL